MADQREKAQKISFAEALLTTPPSSSQSSARSWTLSPPAQAKGGRREKAHEIFFAEALTTTPPSSTRSSTKSWPPNFGRRLNLDLHLPGRSQRVPHTGRTAATALPGRVRTLGQRTTQKARGLAPSDKKALIIISIAVLVFAAGLIGVFLGLGWKAHEPYNFGRSYYGTSTHNSSKSDTRLEAMSSMAQTPADEDATSTTAEPSTPVSTSASQTHDSVTSRDTTAPLSAPTTHQPSPSIPNTTLITITSPSTMSSIISSSSASITDTALSMQALTGLNPAQIASMLKSMEQQRASGKPSDSGSDWSAPFGDFGQWGESQTWGPDAEFTGAPSGPGGHRDYRAAA